mmetsp:Transcript_26846/g.68870  ORF Transcript_26846/g.68870 Transcript_26846/m.68870 type:complete len:401 (+) Transcript_26846:442-1644(+)
MEAGFRFRLRLRCARRSNGGASGSLRARPGGTCAALGCARCRGGSASGGLPARFGLGLRCAGRHSGRSGASGSLRARPGLGLGHGLGVGNCLGILRVRLRANALHTRLHGDLAFDDVLLHIHRGDLEVQEFVSDPEAALLRLEGAVADKANVRPHAGLQHVRDLAGNLQSDLRLRERTACLVLPAAGRACLDSCGPLLLPLQLFILLLLRVCHLLLLDDADEPRCGIPDVALLRNTRNELLSRSLSHQQGLILQHLQGVLADAAGATKLDVLQQRGRVLLQVRLLDQVLPPDAQQLPLQPLPLMSVPRSLHGLSTLQPADIGPLANLLPHGVRHRQHAPLGGGPGSVPQHQGTTAAVRGGVPGRVREEVEDEVPLGEAEGHAVEAILALDATLEVHAELL